MRKISNRTRISRGIFLFILGSVLTLLLERHALWVIVGGVVPSGLYASWSYLTDCGYRIRFPVIFRSPISRENPKERSNSIDHNFQDIDLTGWYGHEEYELGVAACLWANVQPSQENVWNMAKPYYAKLCSAIQARKLIHKISNRSEEIKRNRPDMPDFFLEYCTTISAINLRIYADSIRDVPDFLKDVTVPTRATEELPF